jgi:N-acyl-D-aspartate/D-glutamate deacylase
MAPVNDEAAEHVMRMLARVVGMPIRALEAGVPWTWSSFGGWLEQVGEAGLVVNAGFLVGHSTLRRTVMGPRAVGEAATPGDLSAMLAARRDSLAAGVSLVGRTVGDVAGAMGHDPFEMLVDLVVADELGTVFTPPPVGDDDESWQLRAQVWQDRRTVIGASDAGAHLDVASSFTYTTSVLRRRVLALEEAVHQLTDVPRRVVGLRHRGRLLPGWWADLVCFDEVTVGPGEVHLRQDLPGGARRLFAPAIGVEHVVVNGVEVVSSGALTGEQPGRVRRSGRDTETVGARA